MDNESERDSIFEDFDPDSVPGPPGDDFPPHRHNAHQEEPDSAEAFSPEPQPTSPSSRQMRQTFLKLASLFHPDKVADSEQQIYHNEIMKEVNRAYQEGDIARLLEIERQHHLQENIDLHNTAQSEIERLCLQLQRDNELLATQYENLKQEGSIARNSPEGEMVKEYRAAKKTGA